jgi:hypothetical protein
MNRCSSCGKKVADDEPPLCESCFCQECIQDPGCPDYPWILKHHPEILEQIDFFEES